MPLRRPLVSVVIVNWNGLDDTKECLKYLKDQTYRDLELIVVDNGSTDGSLRYLEGLENIILVRNPKNLGFTGGHIAGYKASHGEYILLLNNDAIMDKQYISRAVKVMTGDKDIGALGGRAYLWDDDNPLFSTGNRYYGYQNINPLTGEGIFTQYDNGCPAEVNNVSGSCVLVNRKAVNKVGYLHDPFFAYYEESDLFARMKRAGFKIIYHPELAIWHANAKTSNKKAPTFSLYMMMRNRFRFAVRNFDDWSLLRFMKFYLIMGCASLIRIVTDSNQRPMHKAYAKAFLYNCAFGAKAFYERYKLRRQLGKSDYNRQIIKEQSPVSILAAPTVAGLAGYISLGKELDGRNEIAITVADQKLLRQLASVTHIRYCLDRKYFKARPENFSAIIALNDWLIITSGHHAPSLQTINRYRNMIYDLNRGGYTAAVITSSINDSDDIFKAVLDSTMIIRRTAFINAGGLSNDSRGTTAFRCLLLFCYLEGRLLQIHDKPASELSPSELKPEKLNILIDKYTNVVSKNRQLPKANLFTRLNAKYYRLFQFTNLIKWAVSSKIPLRLKAGRLKNLVVYSLTFNRRQLATELRHIRNEASPISALNNQSRTEQVNERLAYLSDHPEDTPVFIICRDRLVMLKKLLKWLESQGFRRVTLIDNDSLFPPLVNYLRNNDHQVLEMGRNTKQTGLWDQGIIRLLVPEDFYIVTDPDIMPVHNDKGSIKYFYSLHKKYPHHLKVGYGLKIDDLPDHYPLKKQVVEWESQFWKTELEEEVYEAGIDTTFAVYKPYTYAYTLHPSIRTGREHVAKHLPWYENTKKLSEEEIFYRLRQDQTVSSWNVDELPLRYQEELAKQR